MKAVPISDIKASDAIKRLNPHLWGEQGPQLASPGQPSTRPDGQAKTRKARPMTKTEAQAKRLLEASGNYSEVRYPAPRLPMANGHWYTPDLCCIPHDPNDLLLFVEVKGAYRLGSLQRSKLAYDQARHEWRSFRFAWMEKQRDGTWRVDGAEYP